MHLKGRRLADKQQQYGCLIREKSIFCYAFSKGCDHISVVYYNLGTRYDLGSFASGMIEKGSSNNPPVEWTTASNDLPKVPGIYVIVNSFNSYVGIANDLQSRFKSRAEAVHHLGFSKETMQQIYVWRGDVQVWDTPQAPPPKIPLNTDPDMKLMQGAPRPFSAFPNVDVDGGQPINVEHLLIRFYNSKDTTLLTNTNTRLVQMPFANNTGQDLHVYIRIIKFDKFGKERTIYVRVRKGEAL